MRLLPIFLIADVSGSMAGDSIKKVWELFKDILTVIHQDPYALEISRITVMTYSQDVNVLTKFCDCSEFSMPEMPIITSGPKNCGLAIAKAIEMYNNNFTKTTINVRGDRKPFICIATKGLPSDIANFKFVIEEIKKLGFERIAVFHGNKNKIQPYLELTNDIIPLYDYSVNDIKKLFCWVDSSTFEIETNDISSVELPPPPSTINIVI